MRRVIRVVRRCLGCGRFLRSEDVAHGGKREFWHERCALRAEERRKFREELDDAGHEQTGESQDYEW